MKPPIEHPDALWQEEHYCPICHIPAAVKPHAVDGEARRIARTEVVGTSNAANLAAWHQSGVVDGKEWLAITADGKSGVASEDINCRCTGLAVVNDPSKAVRRSLEERKAMGDAEERRRESLEEALERAVRRGLRAQRDAVLAALRG